MPWEPLAEWGPLDSDFDELSPPSIYGLVFKFIFRILTKTIFAFRCALII